MKKMLLAICLLAIMVACPIAAAAPVPQLVQELDITADNAVTPLDYSFFDSSSTGKLEFYNIKNLYGAGAGMIFYIYTPSAENGSDWLQLKFGGGMVEITLMKRQIALMTEKVMAITAKTPLVITIQDDKLTVSIGKKSRTVQDVTSFKGSLTTQSIEGKLKAYQFVEQ